MLQHGPFVPPVLSCIASMVVARDFAWRSHHSFSLLAQRKSGPLIRDLASLLFLCRRMYSETLSIDHACAVCLVRQSSGQAGGFAQGDNRARCPAISATIVKHT